MAQSAIKVSADFNNDGTMDVVWAGKSDTLNSANLGDGLVNQDVTVMGQAVTKLFLAPATATKLGGVAVNGNGLVLDPSTNVLKIKLGTGLTVGTDGALNASGGSSFTGSIDDITESANRVFFSPTERTKLAGVEANANDYIHPATHGLDMITETDTLKIMTANERSKLAGIEEGANHYVHPATHPAAMIVEDTDKLFMTSAERQKVASLNLNGTSSGYVPPSTWPATMITEDAGHAWLTQADKTRLEAIQNGFGRFSGATAQDSIKGESLATLVSGETITSDNNQYAVFHTAHKNIINGSIAFSKDGILINPAAYTVDYANGVITLYVAGSAGTYTITYAYSATGTLQTTYHPVVASTVVLYKDGVIVPSSSYTVDLPSGTITLTQSLGSGNYTADYTHSQGTVIFLKTALPNTSYTISITPNVATNGTLGEFWIDKKSVDRFIVRNTGSNNTATFDYMVMPAAVTLS
jgi:hypothetical protein